MKVVGNILVILVLTLSVMGQDKLGRKDYGTVDPVKLLVNPVQYDGKLVEISGEVVSINANHKFMDVFDARTKVIIIVSLQRLTEAEQHSLINDPVHRVSVFGKLEMKGGRARIQADRVLPLAATLMGIQ